MGELTKGRRDARRREVEAESRLAAIRAKAAARTGWQPWMTDEVGWARSGRTGRNRWKCWTRDVTGMSAASKAARRGEAAMSERHPAGTRADARAEAMPDPAPGYEWYRELADEPFAAQGADDG